MSNTIRSIQSKLPNSGTTIFSKISALAKHHDAVNLGQGFPNFDVDPELLDLIAHYSRAGKNQYAASVGVAELRQAIADKIQLLYRRSINIDSEICITAGATQAIYTAIQALIHLGDEVIIIEPAYDSYAPSVRLAGGVVVPHALTAPEYHLDWTELDSLITTKTRMIIINSPQNPTGKVFSAADMAELERIMSRHSELLILSDEVYEHLTFDNVNHQSVLAYPTIYERAMAIFSFGKTFHATGWKVGYIVGPEYLMSEFKNVHQWNVYSVNSFIQYALADYVKDESHYLNLGPMYQQMRYRFLSYIAGSRLEPLSSQGSYYLCLDCSTLSDLDDQALAIDLIEKSGVATIPVSSFYSDQSYSSSTILRVCFAKNTNTLHEGADRLIDYFS